MILDLSSLKKAIDSMDRALGFANQRMNKKNLQQGEIEVLKAAIIQNFEFTYELCWKFMKRWLETNLTPGLMEGVSRRQLFRYAAENRLILDIDTWVGYHELRNKTSHTYDSEVADEIFASAGGFLQEAKSLLSAIEERND